MFEQIQQKTIRHRTYLKTAVVEAMQSVFAQHPDQLLRDTKVRIDWSFEEVDYPAVIVRAYIRDDEAAGVGHVEYKKDPETDTVVKMKRRLYHGDLEFAVYALSSQDRDLIMDTLTQVLGMSDMATWTYNFYLRLYNPDEWARIQGLTQEEFGEHHFYHLTNVNTDRITETGESQVPAPWQPEDVLLYQNSARIPIFGEVLSLPPEITWTTIQRVIAYPYQGGLEAVPTGEDDPAPWIPDSYSS